METNEEKRVHERHVFSADVVFSYFNKENSYSAQTMNLSPGGMCLKSSLFLQPRATVYIRLKKIHPDTTIAGLCEGLHYVTLAEVKWCYEVEVAGKETSYYGVGVKYFEPVY